MTNQSSVVQSGLLDSLRCLYFVANIFSVTFELSDQSQEDNETKLASNVHHIVITTKLKKISIGIVGTRHESHAVLKL